MTIRDNNFKYVVFHRSRLASTIFSAPDEMGPVQVENKG